MFLQRISQTGHLTTLNVHAQHSSSTTPTPNISSLPTLILLAYIATTFSTRTPSFLLAISVLLSSRFLSTWAHRSLLMEQWHGASEPGVHGDLLILLSQDRWIRMKGLVDDLKAVTSGAWLAQSTNVTGIVQWLASFLVYVSAIVLAGADNMEKLLLVGAVLAGNVLLSYENSGTKELFMHGRRLAVSDSKDSVKKYARRLDMAHELIREVGRSDFAVRLGMTNPDQVEALSGNVDASEKKVGLENEVVTM